MDNVLKVSSKSNSNSVAGAIVAVLSERGFVAPRFTPIKKASDYSDAYLIIPCK